MGIQIERPHEKRLVLWRNSDMSNEIILLPGAAWNLYVPSTFAGTQVTIWTLVQREISDAATSEGPINAYKRYGTGSSGIVTVEADRVIDLTDFSLFGLNKIKLQSDASENCTGEILMTS